MEMNMLRSEETMREVTTDPIRKTEGEVMLVFFQHILCN